ncbi:MAG: hypothetical protein V1729_05550 [Candidatus Woesearchaeota archaeon]
MKHQNYAKGYDGTLQELAQSIGNMRYDSVAEFIQYLSEDLKRQAEGDRNRGRPKLASKLEMTAEQLSQAKQKMDEIWTLCKPYMMDKTKKKE